MLWQGIESFFLCGQTMQEPSCYLTVRIDSDMATLELSACFIWDETFAVWTQVSNDAYGPRFFSKHGVIAVRPVH